MDTPQSSLEKLRHRLGQTLDSARTEAVSKRHAKGLRSARENLADLCDPGSFQEIGQLAVAAQRLRRGYEDLQKNTPADGIILGVATINADQLVDAKAQSRVAVVINDYTVLAGTQGFFHHKKLDRILQIAEREKLPVVMYTEGGGGRPGDTDPTTIACGLELNTFYAWAKLAGIVPRIVVNNGYCFAGNAALFGAGDIRIATRNSWIGMAGPAMIEGGGLGIVQPEEIGPTELQEKTGVVDVVAEDEVHATALARQLIGYFQGRMSDWQPPATSIDLREALPNDRRYGYDVRAIITGIVDSGSFIELREHFGGGAVTGFCRFEGRPVGLVASDCRVMGGALDAPASDKLSAFYRLCEAHRIPVVVLVDTPGFMVGVQSETQAAVTRCSDLFTAGAKLTVPLVAIVLRKAYGLGAMALVGGSFSRPIYAAAWPSGEFGAMGLEGAVKLGFKKELDAEPDEASRKALFSKLLLQLYSRGKATEIAAHVEIDAVIDPADTRAVIIRTLGGCEGKEWTKWT